jgi:hypothetical protein
MLKLLDLFSGIGGFSLGMEATNRIKTIAFVEKDKFCQKVLNKNFKNIPIEEDIRNVKGSNYTATLFQEDSPVNHSALQENEKEKMMTATSGMKLLELLPKQNQNGLLEKMLKELLTSPMVQSCNRYNKTWKKRVSKSNVLLFQLQVSVLGIKEKESGLSDVMYQTPTATEIPMRSKEAMEKRKKYRESIGRKTVPHGNLLEQIQMMYPTPTQDSASERTKKYNQGGLPLPVAVRMYPTPTQGMWKQDVNDNGEYAKRVKEKGHQVMLPTFVKLYPTPRACDMEGGVVKNVEIKDGTFSRVNKKGVRFGVKLKDAVHKLYPTPTARDYKDAAYQPNWKESRDKSLPREILKNNKPGGRLNPHFVEFLMAYPMNWTKIEPTE